MKINRVKRQHLKDAVEEIAQKKILNVLWDHFSYSIEDINSYEELTEMERSFIDRDTFEMMTTPTSLKKPSNSYDYRNEYPSYEERFIKKLDY